MDSGATNEAEIVRRRGGTVLVWCALSLIVLASIIYFGPQTITYYRMRPVVVRSPDLPPRGWYSIPRPLANTIASTAEGSALSHFGYSFEVPWKPIDKEWNEGQFVEVRFKTGQIVKIQNPEFLKNDLIRVHRVSPCGDCYTLNGDLP